MAPRSNEIRVADQDDVPALGLSVGQCATLACLLEVSAAKPGNVHRGADFTDVTYLDFVASAVAIGPVVDAAEATPLGRTVLSAVLATRRVVTTNTNLGTLLLLAPLCKVPRHAALAAGVVKVLDGLNRDDATQVYEAIRAANPGGLGRVDEADVADQAPSDLVAAMALAADRDLVARQYADGFHHVLRLVVPWLEEGLRRGWTLDDSIIHTHVRLMSQVPDSLIARKCGNAVARESADRAAAVLEAGEPGDESYGHRLAALDGWLREDGHRRNPGTTSDLIAAGLFAALRDGIINPPF